MGGPVFGFRAILEAVRSSPAVRAPKSPQELLEIIAELREFLAEESWGSCVLDDGKRGLLFFGRPNHVRLHPITVFLLVLPCFCFCAVF